MTKLIKVAFQKDMIKVNDNGKEVWYNCEKAVKNFIKSAFKEATCNKENKVLEEGEEIVLTTEQRNDETGKSCTFVTRASKAGQAAQGGYTPPPAVGSAPAAPASAPAPYKAPYGEKSPEVQALIVKQSTMASACQAMQVLTGQITDVNDLAGKVLFLYNTMLAEIKR